MNRRSLVLAGVLSLAALAPALAQESGRIIPLVFRIIPLDIKVSEAAGKIESMQVRETPTEIRIDLAADVLFEFDEATLLPAAEETLGRAAAVLRERGTGSVVRIEGHTDSKGDEAYNQRLSQQRAASVRDWLQKNGGSSGIRFEISGLGETRPAAPNEKPDGSDDPEGRQKNRRVEIVIRKG